jgi:hypothetical protein
MSRQAKEALINRGPARAADRRKTR